MALALDDQSPLQETLAGSRSFDFEDGEAAWERGTQRQRVSKVVQAILLSLGLIFIMAMIGTPEICDPQALRKFAGSVFSPPRSPPTSTLHHHDQTSTIDNNPDAIPRKSDTVVPVAPVVPNLPGRAPSPGMLSASTEQVCMLLTLIGLGKLLQNRFPGDEPNVIQKVLLQFLFPASLFKGLSSLSLQMSQLGYVAAGIFFVFARLSCSWIASRAILGSSPQLERAAIRRTATFQFATTSYALSVMPFVSEFIGGELVGLGSLVDLPMKFYMLIVMPALLVFNDERGKQPSKDGTGVSKAAKKIKKLFTDPITLSLILGLITAAITGGRGCAALGFLGKAVMSLAGSQTAVLFLLIGLKLKFDSATPLFSIVILFASQGLLLLLAALICSTFPMSVVMQQFVCFFAQGAPSVLGLGIITTAAKDGTKGYNLDMAFDIIALACPISAMFQCAAGVFGPAYPKFAGLFGAALLGIAGVMRLAFADKFKVDAGDEKPTALQAVPA